MIEIEKPRIESAEIKSDGTYGKFILEPLERGYGTILGQQPETGIALLASRCCCDVAKNRRGTA